MSQRGFPAQEDVTGTYMGTPVIAHLIQDYLVGNQPVEPEGMTLKGMVAGGWNALLHSYFPITDGYLSGFETVSADGGANLITACVTQMMEGRLEKFLVVGCKAPEPALEGEDIKWEEGAEQLEGYLRTVDGNQRKFGALAVGKYVRFYELSAGRLVDFDDDKNHLLLDRQCQTILGKLAYFRDNRLG